MRKVRDPLLVHVPAQRDPDRHLRKAMANVDVRGAVNICGLTNELYSLWIMSPRCPRAAINSQRWSPAATREHEASGVWSTFQAGHVRPCASLSSDLPQDLAPIFLTLKIKHAR
jgi:hypothetical protein